MNLSIVIPVYNVQNHIGKTIESLLGQSRNDFEVIIVDNGSTDNSILVAKKIIDEGNVRNYKLRHLRGLKREMTLMSL